jgi:uncharacterized protein YndB with AHSA1/START domain
VSGEPIVSRARGTFSLMCRVEITIRAAAERIWARLTDAADFPRWNASVTKIEGQIREGERLRLHVFRARTARPIS